MVVTYLSSLRLVNVTGQTWDGNSSLLVYAHSIIMHKICSQKTLRLTCSIESQEEQIAVSEIDKYILHAWVQTTAHILGHYIKYEKTSWFGVDGYNAIACWPILLTVIGKWNNRFAFSSSVAVREWNTGEINLC